MTERSMGWLPVDPALRCRPPLTGGVAMAGLLCCSPAPQVPAKLACAGSGGGWVKRADAPLPGPGDALVDARAADLGVTAEEETAGAGCGGIVGWGPSAPWGDAICACLATALPCAPPASGLAAEDVSPGRQASRSPGSRVPWTRPGRARAGGVPGAEDCPVPAPWRGMR
mmetsp:Transcript_7189/g.20881  ORF Transcript_7189/g.20881 Transcript_7189/m.20881 type:complete len:170 (+) Transcript_7189:400-909(+)